MSEYKHNIDTKGRLIIPAKIREKLGDSFTLTRGMDGCLWLHPQHEWDEFQDRLKQLPMASANGRRFRRFFTSGSTLCEPDKQGRILIPQTLRLFAELKKEVIISWDIDKAEIWSMERWDQNNAFDDMDDIAVDLLNEGFVI